MNRLLQRLFFILLVLTGTQANAYQSVMLSPSIGLALGDDKGGKHNSTFFRADLDYFPEKEYGIGLFFA